MPSSGRPSLPGVFGYDDYRRFVKDRCDAEKRLSRGFSYSVFARRAGVARTYPPLVVAGRRDLSPGGAERFARALRLSAEETEFFRLLVEAGQAETDRAREAARRALHRSRERHGRRVLSAVEAENLGLSWAHYLIMGLSVMKGFRADAGWISRTLEGRVKAAEVRASLRFLKERRYLRFQGRRLVGTSMGEFEVDCRDVSGVPFAERSFREAVEALARAYGRAAPRRAKFVAYSHNLSVLSESEFKDLATKYQQWMDEHIPGRRRGAEGRLYIVSQVIFPVSR